MMKNIRWDASDIEAVAKRSFMIRKNAITPMTPLEAIRRAQDEVLKPNQRRDLTGMHQVVKVVDAWKILEAQGYGSGQQAIQPSVARQETPTLKLEDVSTDDLLTEFMKRISVALDPNTIRAIAREEANRLLEARIPGMFLQQDEAPAEPEEEPAQRKFHVCLLGLEGTQKESMRQEFGSLIDFHFLDGSEGVKRIKSTCEKMDLTIRSRWCKGNLGSTSGWPKYMSAESGGLDTIKRLIKSHFKL